MSAQLGRENVHDLAPEEVARGIAEGKVLLVDVREPNETEVERYPEFVPLCKALRVRSRKPETEGRETVVADMTVGYKLIRETFTSRVTLDR